MPRSVREQIKHQAKRLKKDARKGIPHACTRAELHGYDPSEIIHSEALDIVAREWGFGSFAKVPTEPLT